MHRQQREGVDIEIRRHVLGMGECAVKPVGPAMIWADESGRMATLGVTEARATMAAGIEESANFARAIPQHDDRAIADGDRDEAAGFRNLAAGADEDPLPLEDGGEVEGVDVGVCVESAWEAVARRSLHQHLSHRTTWAAAEWRIVERKAVHRHVL